MGYQYQTEDEQDTRARNVVGAVSLPQQQRRARRRRRVPSWQTCVSSVTTASLTQHARAVSSAASARTGNRLAAGSAGQTRVWTSARRDAGKAARSAGGRTEMVSTPAEIRIYYCS